MTMPSKDLLSRNHYTVVRHGERVQVKYPDAAMDMLIQIGSSP
jgi:hypothetical protein